MEIRITGTLLEIQRSASSTAGVSSQNYTESVVDMVVGMNRWPNDYHS